MKTTATILLLLGLVGVILSENVVSLREFVDHTILETNSVTGADAVGAASRLSTDMSQLRIGVLLAQSGLTNST